MTIVVGCVTAGSKHGAGAGAGAESLYLETTTKQREVTGNNVNF